MCCRDDAGVPVADAAGPLKRSRGRPRKAAERRLCSCAEAARRLGVHRATIGRWIESGRLRAFAVAGSLVRLDMAEVDALAVPLASGPGFSFFSGALSEEDQAHG